MKCRLVLPFPLVWFNRVTPFITIGWNQFLVSPTFSRHKSTSNFQLFNPFLWLWIPISTHSHNFPNTPHWHSRLYVSRLSPLLFLYMCLTWIVSNACLMVYLFFCTSSKRWYFSLYISFFTCLYMCSEIKQCFLYVIYPLGLYHYYIQIMTNNMNIFSSSLNSLCSALLIQMHTLNAIYRGQ